MNRPVVAIVVLGLLSVTFVPFAASASSDGQRLGTPEGFDRTVYRVTVYENGTAQWTFEYSRSLSNESEQEQFEAYATMFERTETDLYRRFVERANALAAVGTNETGRQMRAIGFSRAGNVDSFGNRGIVEMAFLWTNFTVVRGDRVVLGDVFEGGLYVGPDQRLVVQTGPELAFAAVSPQPDRVSSDELATSDSVTWFGERQFSDNRPRVEFAPPSAVETGTETPTGETGGDDTPVSEEAQLPADGEMLVIGLVVLVLGIASAAAWHAGALRETTSHPTDDAGTAAASEAVSSRASGERAVSEDDLLTDDDRVVNLLEENGGRMKQVDIVDETDWSKSKVSMLLSDMEDDGTISKLRVGRENIISLAGEEPDAARSPFDEDE